MKHISPLVPHLIAREYAITAAMRVMQGKELLETTLNQLYLRTELEARDKGFAEYLLRAILKNVNRYERMYGAFLREPANQLPLLAQLLLCAGCVQLHAMKVPAYAAVDSSVELAKYYRLGHLAGLINAVLKKVATLSQEDYPAVLDDAPMWLRTRLMRDYGEAMAERIFISSLADITYTDITIKDIAQLKHWEDTLDAQHYYGQNVRVHDAGNIAALNGFNEGAWWVQDMAASLPVTLVAPLVRGKHVLEIGAAPGGKSMQLASYNAELLAVDRSKARLKIMEENSERTGLTIPTLCADVTADSFIPPMRLYDVVVLDAPCSATGTLRRNPDILFQRTEKDIAQLVAAQRRLLHTASQLVEVEGLLLYIVCSLFHAEGEAQISWFLQHHPAWQHAPLQQMNDSAHPLPGEFFNIAGDYRTQPCYMQEHGGMDGLYAALLQRKE